MNEIASKLWDAMSMFWQSLDDRERYIVLYFALYVALSAAAAYGRARRQRMIAELREELTAAHGSIG